MPSAPPPPAQVDPGQSSLDFIRGMANPELQNELLSAEQRYRPEYNKLELADIDTCFVVAEAKEVCFSNRNLLRERCSDMDLI
jgi:hypothetical protein